MTNINMSLHGDGINPSLFRAIWTKSKNSALCKDFYVADTIVFLLGQPIHWYFTGIDGSILRKRKQNLVIERIEESFLKKGDHLDDDISASFLSTDTEERERGGGCTSIEYFDQISVSELLCFLFPAHFGRRKYHIRC